MFDPEIAEKTDMLLERQIMSFFASKGAGVACGRAAVFLAEHVAAILCPEIRARVWAGCFLELAHWEAPQRGSGGIRLVRELVERESDYGLVAQVLRILVEEVLGGEGAEILAVDVLSETTVHCMRIFPRVQRSPYGVFCELLERLVVGLMESEAWERVRSVVEHVQHSLDATVCLAGAGSGLPDFVAFAKDIVESFAPDRLVALEARAMGVSGTRVLLEALAREVLEAKLRVSEASPSAFLPCHSSAEERALRSGVFFAIKQLVDLLGRHRQADVVASIVVPLCEESPWLWEVLGEGRWRELGKMTDAVMG